MKKLFSMLGMSCMLMALLPLIAEGLSNEEIAGLQLAIWEVSTDSEHDLFSGAFMVASGYLDYQNNSNAIGYASAYLSALIQNFDQADIERLNREYQIFIDPEKQDLIVVRSGQAASLKYVRYEWTEVNFYIEYIEIENIIWEISTGEFQIVFYDEHKQPLNNEEWFPALCVEPFSPISTGEFLTSSITPGAFHNGAGLKAAWLFDTYYYSSVPEPATMLLVAIGLPVLLAIGRSSKRFRK